MNNNARESFSSLDRAQLAGVVGGAWPSKEADGGGTIVRPFGLSNFNLGQVSPSDPTRCGAPKHLGNQSRAAFPGTSAFGLSAGGVPIAQPIAVCPRVPQFGNK